MSHSGGVLVVGGYGYRNLGDEAILAGLLRSIGDQPVTVVSRHPAETRRIHGVRSIGIGGVLAALGSHRSVVIGGGGLFGRDMGRLGRLLPLFGELAARGGRRVDITGVGIDVDMPLPARVTLRRLLRVAASITVRDAESAAILAGWGTRATMAPDLSTAMPELASGSGLRLLSAARVDISRPIVGLALTAIDRRLGDQAVDAAAAAMAAFPAVEFCFVPMARHPSVPDHDDARLAERLREREPRLRIVDVEHPAEALAMFGCFSAVVGMRYHSFLFAERAGVPLLAIPYAEKCRHWLVDRALDPVAANPAALVLALAGALGQRAPLVLAS